MATGYDVASRKFLEFSIQGSNMAEKILKAEEVGYLDSWGLTNTAAVRDTVNVFVI